MQAPGFEEIDKGLEKTARNSLPINKQLGHSKYSMVRSLKTTYRNVFTA